MPALRKHSTAVTRQTLPGHGEYNSTKKKKTSKMNKLRNHPQSNQQETSPKAVNNETDLCSLTDLEFKREIVKILKELREDMNSNADSLRKELENIRRSQEKLEHSLAEIQTIRRNGQFLESYSLPKLNQKETDQLNKPITRNEIEEVIKNTPYK